MSVDLERPDLAELPKALQEAIKQLINSSSEEVSLTLDFATGAINRLFGRFPTGTKMRMAAEQFLSKHTTLFNLPYDLDGFDLVAQNNAEGTRKVHFQQQHNSIPIFAAGITVSVTETGDVTEVCTRISPKLDVDTTPKTDEWEALEIARSALAIDGPIDLRGSLAILDTDSLFSDGLAPRLTWQFSIEGPEGQQRIFIDAHEGIVSLSYFTPTGSPSVDDCPTNALPQYHLHPACDTPNFITFGPNGLWIPESASGSPEQVALAFFRRYPFTFATADANNQLRVIGVERDLISPHMSHVILQQIYSGVPVFGCGLRVHLTVARTISSISGNYVRFMPVVPVPQISETKARDRAVFEIRGMRQQVGITSDPSVDVQDLGLVIYPGILSQTPGSRSALAWHFNFPEAQLLITAINDERLSEILCMIPNQLAQRRLVIDALQGNELNTIPGPSTVILDNSVQQPGAPSATPEQLTADANMLDIHGDFAGLGWSGYDSRGSDLAFVTNATFVVSPGAAAHWDVIRRQAWFTLGTAADRETCGHEFTHGVTHHGPTAAGLIPLDEPGAVGEHYCDIFGMFVAGVPTPVGSPLRNPGIAHYSQFLIRMGACIDPVNVLIACDAGFVHANAGVGNRAAVLIADGNFVEGGTHGGIGRNRLARLFLNTLTSRLYKWATYIDERLNTWQAARDFAARGTLVVNDTPGGPPLDFAGVANEVSWAFHQVGIDPRLTTGWYKVQVGLTGQHSGRDTQTFNLGTQTRTCMLVGDVELQVRAYDPITGGIPWWSGSARIPALPPPPPPTAGVIFPGGLFGATIVSHHVGTRNMEITVDYFHSGFLPFEFRADITEVPDPSCPTPPTIPPQSEFDFGPIAHWASVPGTGGRGTDQLNWSFLVREPGGVGCIVDLVEVELLDSSYNIVGRTRLGDPPAIIRYGAASALSYGVEVRRAMTGSSSPGVDVHWWFDVGSACRYRVHYYCTGDNCAIR